MNMKIHSAHVHSAYSPNTPCATVRHVIPPKSLGVLMQTSDPAAVHRGTG